MSDSDEQATEARVVSLYLDGKLLAELEAWRAARLQTRKRDGLLVPMSRTAAVEEAIRLLLARESNSPTLTIGETS